jgi:nitrite reductase/ring-hydroxylating ferredoxin subunit
MENIKIKLNHLPQKINQCNYYDFPKNKIEIGIVKLDMKTYKVFNSFCPHFGGKLEYKNNNLYCYFHDYKYDSENGKCINRKIGSRCTIYHYEIKDGFLKI